MAVFLTLVLGLVILEVALAMDPCTQANLPANLIDEPFRSTGYQVKDKDYENLICDRLLPTGWYKFSGGNTMSETCPDSYRCGTHVPIWLHGSHPAVADGIVTIETCGHTDSGCCGYKDHIRVKNCGTFYAYELRPSRGCSAGYCAGTGTPCPPDKWSATGFEPGCIPAFPKMTQSPQLSPPIVKPDTFVFKCHIPFDHTRTDVGFQVTWLYDGKPDPKTPVTQVTGGARDAYLDQKYIEDHLGRELTCAVRTYFLKSPGRKGPPVPSNPYWAGIKLSTPRLTVGENEKPKTVQIISTIPIVCNKASQASCRLEMYLDPNNHDIRQTTSCTQTLKPGDWDPVTHQAVTSFQVLAERDYKKDGDKNLALHFQPIFSVDAPAVFNNYQIPYLQIQTKDKDTAMCSCTGDPHCLTMDQQLAKGPRYNYYKVGEFTMYKSTSRPFEVQARTWHCGHVSCNCAVAVREGNDVITIDLCHGTYGHTYPKLRVQHQGQISQGTVVHRDKAGNHFLIDFPSGAWVKVDCNTRYMNIYIHAPEEDYGATEGLCGTFNRRTTDDLTDRNGHVNHWSSVPNSFVESWRLGKLWLNRSNGQTTVLTLIRQLLQEMSNLDLYCLQNKIRVPIGTSMFDKEVPIDPKYNNNIYYCNCDKQKKLVDCRIDNKAARPAIHTRCAGCNVLAVAGGNQGTGRKRRATTAAVETGIASYYFDYGFLWFPTMGSFPTKSGLTQTDAEKVCNDRLHASPVVQKCISQIGVNVRSVVDMCVDDIKQMDNMDFVQDAVDVVIMDCMERAIKDPVYFDNSTGLPPAFITTDRCPSQCSGNGVCVHGNCRCKAGYSGDGCEIDTTKPPSLAAIDTTDPYVRTSDICDVTVKPCQTVTVIGDNMAPLSKLHCRLLEMKFDGTRFSPTGHTVTVGVDYISMYSVACRMPVQPSSHGNAGVGYNISVTNNGVDYSNPVPSFIVNSTCMSCSPNGGQCSIKTSTCLIDGVCRSHGETSPSSANHVCDANKNNKGWTVVHSAVTKPHSATQKTTASPRPSGSVSPTIPYPVAPLGGTELARFDVWTTTKTGCPCKHNKALTTCACCDDGGCQCPGINTNQCTHCGDQAACGTPQTAPDFGVDGYTLAMADCQCKFDPTQYNCACCQSSVNACQCGREHKNQCVDCNHMDTCGSKPWIFGPPMPST